MRIGRGVGEDDVPAACSVRLLHVAPSPQPLGSTVAFGAVGLTYINGNSVKTNTKTSCINYRPDLGLI